MEPLWRYNLDECQITLNQTVDNSIDVAIQVVKSVGFALHVVFFIVVAAIKEFHTQSSIFLINLGLDAVEQRYLQILREGEGPIPSV